MKKIGIQGIEGSFSEEAAKSYCQKFGISDFELAYLVSSMNELENNKQIIRELNLLGQTNNPNSVENIKIYIYDDGSVEKVKYIHK